MSKTIAMCCSLTVGSVAALAQAPPPSFEVADVKINKSGEVRMTVDMQPGGKLIMHNVPMRVMLALAYHVRPDAMTNEPAWLGSDRFDVIAKAPQTASPDQMRQMLKTLLAERFKLAVHMDEKVMPAFALIVAKSGSKMEGTEGAPLSEQGCRPGEGVPGQRHMVCKHTSMPLLADSLQEMSPADFPAAVVDQTGLTGAFNFKLDWTPTLRAPTGTAASATAPATLPEPMAGPALFDAVESQLGLKIERRRVPVAVISIDRIERVPTDN
jgi:uncharacterized protein (TIGR03435 family)